MAWITIKASEIPAKNITTNRQSWKPDVEDVTAVFSMLLNGSEAIMMKMADSNAASKKAEAMLKWLKSQPSIPTTMTAFSRDGNVIITDLRILNG